MKKLFQFAGIISLSCMVAACGGSEDKLVSQIDERINRDLCFTAPSINQNLQAGWDSWVDGIVKAGYAEKADGGASFIFNGKSYAYTDEGKAQMKMGRLCYGTPKVREILDKSKPYEEQGREFMTVEVEIYNHVNDPWSKSKLMREDLEKKSETQTYRFVKRDKDGWVLQ